MARTKQSAIDYGALQTELTTILSNLQADDGDIDAALKQYARGLEIVTLLESHLQTAENSVRELTSSFAE